MTTVVNQYGNIIDGTARDMIIDAVNKDKETVSVDKHIIIIHSVTASDSGKIIKVEI